MTEKNEKEQRKFLERFIRFMKEEGFVYGPSPEIYGGLAGFYTYGPMGKLLKQSMENFLRKHFYYFDFNEVELPTIMPEDVWKASGHVKNFTDPVITCSSCHSTFRADTLIKDQIGDVPLSKMKEYIPKLKCPTCGGKFNSEITYKSLMMKTIVGLDTVAYARPETATTTYLPYINYSHYFRNKLPFGVFQIGKAYRNEISPRKHIMRSREFTQAEAQLFLFENQKNRYTERLSEFDFKLNLRDDKDKEWNLTISEAFEKKLFQNSAYAFAVAITYKSFIEMGLGERIRLRQHKPDEKAFYALDAWDVEVKLNSFSWSEICGVHDRGKYDLTQHSEYSHKSLSTFNEETGQQEIPHIIEIAYGVDRILFSVLDSSFNHLDKSEGKTTLQLPMSIIAIPVALFPLMKKDHLISKAKEILYMLKKHYVIYYDESGAIGRRYLRANKKGIPFALTVDFETLEDDTITVRDRDSEKQIRVKISEIERVLKELLSGSKGYFE